MSGALVGGGSTQSRARRPLPPGVVSARTFFADGAREIVTFTYANDREVNQPLLSWIGGQWGGLWGALGLDTVKTLPVPIFHALHNHETPGSYGHFHEHALADTLAEIYAPYIPGALGVRLALGGSEACDMAVRIARAVTGRWPIVTYGYHGHNDSVSHLPNVLGIVPEVSRLNRRVEWGDVAGLRELAKDAACVFVEVPAVDDDAARSFLAACRAVCDETGALFIVDDVVLGARVALAGSCEAYGAQPDMVILGKCISAVGLCSAVVGRYELVNEVATRVFYSGTFFGHPGVSAVANATLRWLMANREEAYTHLYLIGSELQAGLNALGIRTVGQPVRSVMQFETDAAWLAFCGRMIERGVMMHRPQFPSLAHTLSDVARTFEAAAAVCALPAAA